MWFAPGAGWAKTAFALSKLWILILPLVWLIWMDRRRPKVPRLRGAGMWAACLTGSLIFNAIAAGYWLIAKPLNWIDVAAMSQRAIEIGLDTPMRYILLAVYWCTINSILEEYVWRWFVLTRCEALTGRGKAVALSALLFTLHHILALAVYFDWRVTVLASIGVFVGGLTWSWLYLRYRNIYAAYISHVFADVVIFIIGYQLIFASG